MNLNILRVGEPKLRPGSGAYQSPSLKVQKEYEIETTKLPEWPRGENWLKYFNAQLCGDPFRAEHDGIDKITVWCHPDEHPDWLERVDAEIMKANEHDETIPYDKRLNS